MVGTFYLVSTHLESRLPLVNALKLEGGAGVYAFRKRSHLFEHVEVYQWNDDRSCAGGRLERIKLFSWNFNKLL